MYPVMFWLFIKAKNLNFPLQEHIVYYNCHLFIGLIAFGLNHFICRESKTFPELSNTSKNVV